MSMEGRVLSREEAVDEIQRLTFRLENKERELVMLRKMFEYPPGAPVVLGSADKGSLTWSVENDGRITILCRTIDRPDAGKLRLKPNELLALSYKEGKAQLMRLPRKE